MELPDVTPRFPRDGREEFRPAGPGPRPCSMACTAGGSVLYRETNGEARGHAVRYASFDASDPLAAALENATYAPGLGQAPATDDDSTHSARASLGAVVNGATGAANPEHQGLSSAILDGLDPLNILRWLPQQGRYSPLWDVHIVALVA